MKNIPLRIFIMVLIAGVIGILGVSILTIDVAMLSDTYDEITTEYSQNMKIAESIETLLYKHQAVVSKHIAADKEEKLSQYEKEADEIKQELNASFSELGQNMQGGEREQIFHNAYTNFNSYIFNADAAIDFSREGQDNTANYYVVNILDENIRTVCTAFDDLDNYVEAEIVRAQERMDSYIHFSRISAFIAIPVIAAAVIVCSLLCFKITLNLNSYKDELEIDIENKNRALIEHNRKMMRLQDTTIIGMANLIESRDGDTGEHVKRTSAYVAMLARAAKQAGYEPQTLDDAYIELLIKAAPLHDIGKIAVSDTILMKPARLTPEEFEIMKRHASEGGRIVRDVIGEFGDEDYVQIASDVAAYHHEKWDGSGYNSGLSGTEIPLCARIMAIADVFDALISKRCYKEKFSADEAFKIIADGAGKHFDPTLADIFLGLRGEIEDYLNTIEE